MEMKVEKITPEMAAKYLKRNVDNYRRISKSKVAQYAAEMKAGKWQTNGEGIMFAQDGKLKNGQHRLAAILQAGIPVEMAVITGVPDDVTIYDVGSNRSTVQIAQASGCDGMTRLEAAVGTAVVSRIGTPPSKGQILDYLKAHEGELNRAYRITNGGRKGYSRRMGVVLAAYLMLRLNKMPSYEIEVFVKIFNSGNTVGADGYEPSPALVARRMCDDRFKNNYGTYAAQRDLTEVMVLAMTDFHSGKARQMNYQLKEPMRSLALLDELRSKDGIA